MARIRGRGNRATELRMMEILGANGLAAESEGVWEAGFCLSQGTGGGICGRLVACLSAGHAKWAPRLRKRYRVAFFHGCPKPRHAPLPKTNAEFWATKLAKNKERDAMVTATLQTEGWRVLRIWECDLARKNWEKVAGRVKVALGRPGSVVSFGGLVAVRGGPP